MVTADHLCDRVAFLVDGRIAALDAPRALRLAHGRRSVRIETERDGTRASHEFPLDGLAGNQAFLNLLHGGHIETIHTLETTLEDVFIQVTGAPLA
jgi:fluoroquinolone transport system ATP-binding protein